MERMDNFRMLPQLSVLFPLEDFSSMVTVAGIAIPYRSGNRTALAYMYIYGILHSLLRGNLMTRFNWSVPNNARRIDASGQI